MKMQEGHKQLREKVRVLERKLGVLKESEVSCHRISLAQCHALVEIGRKENMSLNELAKLLNLDNSTMSRTVNSLVTIGFVNRDTDPQDRRYITLSLTEDGKKLFTKIEAGMDSYFFRIFQSIAEDKKEQLLESLELLIDAVKVAEDASGGER